MMEEDRNGNKCLICSCSIITSTARESKSKGSNSFSSASVGSSAATKHQFYRHLYVIFILRNILELPVHQLASHLRNNWEIQDWISLCDNCDALVVQCRGIYDQLVKISKKFKLCQQEIIKLVKENSDSSVGVEKSKLQAVNYSDQEEKNNNGFVEEIHNFVLKNDYEHLIDPLEKTRPWTCPNKVNSEIAKPNQENLVTDSVVKTEPDEDDWSPDDNCNNENSMEVQSFRDEDARESEEDELHQEQDENSESKEDEPGCSGSENQDKLKKLKGDGCKPKRKKWTRRQNVFSCPLCQAYKRPISYEKNILWVCFHLDKCLKTLREESSHSASDFNVSILKCGFCSMYSCSVNDIIGFANHLVSCIFPFTSTSLQHRIFHCNICPDKKGSRQRYFSLDGFLRHYSYHHRQKYECTECRCLISTTDQIHSHWRLHHKDLAVSLVDYSTCVLKLESPRCPAVPWWCTVCGEVFMEEKARDEHHQSAHSMDSAKEPEKKKKKCQFCERFYYCSDELKLHQGTAHPLESNQLHHHQCEQCSDLFVTEKRLLLHRRRHHKLDLFKCSVCNKGFITKAPLVIHLKSHDNDVKRFGTNEIVESAKTTENRLVCPVEGCGKMYLYRKNLKDHIASHVKKRVYPCTLCGKEFYVEHILKAHEKQVHDESAKKYQCKECPFKTAVRMNLKSHQKHCNSLKKGRPKWTGSLKCEICSKRFLGSIQLEGHKRRQHKIGKGKGRVWNMKERPRTTNTTKTDNDETESSINNNNNATSHENAPEESSNLSCHVCQKEFTIKANLQKHLSNVHKIGAVLERELWCPVEGCGKVYRYRSTFKDHMATHEKKTAYPCTFCEKVFYVQASLKKHVMLLHDESAKKYQCEKCPYKTVHMGSLNVHKKKHNPPQQSNNDNATDGIKTEAETVKQFICQICGRAFKSKGQLKQHQDSLLCKQLHMSMEEATVVCHLCGGRYSTKINLKKHIREQHERIHKVACEHCGKGFYARNEYKQHLAAVHQTGEYYDNKERFKCPVEGCGKILFYPSARKRHIKHHKELEGEPQFKCEQCGKAFSSAVYVYNHVRCVHQGYKYKKKVKKSSRNLVVSSSNSNPTNFNENVTGGDNCEFNEQPASFNY